MYALTLLALASAPLLAAAADPVTITPTLRHACKRPTQKGDTVNMHYRGTLEASGTQFDASYDRGQPLTFAVGAGQVIRGWDEGLLDMCPGDKRTLRIEPEYGYGDRGMGPIPAKSVLIFQTELVSINGVQPEEKVVLEDKEAKAKEDKTEGQAAEPEPIKNPQDGEKKKDEL